MYHLYVPPDFGVFAVKVIVPPPVITPSSETAEPPEVTFTVTSEVSITKPA